MKIVLFRFFIFLFCLLISSGCQNSTHDSDESEALKGPHSGVMLGDQEVKVELSIYERGVEPQFRLYAYKDGVEIDPVDYKPAIVVSRLAMQPQNFEMIAANDFWYSSAIVKEPHSFNVQITVNNGGKNFKYDYEHYEFRSIISAEEASLSGIKTEKVAAGSLKKFLKVRGKIFPSEHRLAHIMPRFAGVVRKGYKHIGDSVQENELLAVIESNESLQPFEVRSQIAGTVVDGHLIVGEFVPVNQWVYIIADLSEVWADFYIPLQDRNKVQVGQQIFISTLNGSEQVAEKIAYQAPYAEQQSQTQLVRVNLPNLNNSFLPGMYVTGDVLVEEIQASMVVKSSAIQTFRGHKVVFIKEGDIFEVRPVKIGGKDGDQVQILEGLDVGQEYVTENAFIIKSDILKSGVEHDH